MIEKRSEISHKILFQIGKAVEKLGGANVELLCIIGSYGDTQEDEDILDLLIAYNETGTIMEEVFCSVYDTPDVADKIQSLSRENSHKIIRAGPPALI